jgi:hypothetical protein
MRVSATLLLLLAFVTSHGQAPTFKKELLKADQYIQQLILPLVGGITAQLPHSKLNTRAQPKLQPWAIHFPFVSFE